MLFEQEANELLQKIDVAFADQLSGEALQKFLREMKLVDEHTSVLVDNKRLELEFRGHPWKEVGNVTYLMSDIDYADMISDAVVLYYLPAFMTDVVKYPQEFFIYGYLEPRILGVLSKLSLAQIDALIAFADFVVMYNTLMGVEMFPKAEQHMIDGYEEFKNYILAYLAEMGSVLKRREGYNQSQD